MKNGSVAGTRYYAGCATRTANTDASGNLTSGTTLTWNIADRHGTGSIAINTTTLQVDRRRSLPFGGPRGAQASGFGTKGFVGGTTDPTGLTHLGAREYDPTTGRFISIDPLFDTADPQSWNGYAYANNAPTNGSDPSGLHTCGDEGIDQCKKHDNGNGQTGSGNGNNNNGGSTTNKDNKKGNPGSGDKPGSAPGCGASGPSAKSASCPTVTVTDPTTLYGTWGCDEIGCFIVADNGDFAADCDGSQLYDVCVAMAKGGRQNIRDSGLRDVSDDELKELENKARGNEKRRYQKELKARGIKHTGNSDSRRAQSAERRC